MGPRVRYRLRRRPPCVISIAQQLLAYGLTLGIGTSGVWESRGVLKGGVSLAIAVMADSPIIEFDRVAEAKGASELYQASV
jgi:hypothetical protein